MCRGVGSGRAVPLPGLLTRCGREGQLRWCSYRLRVCSCVGRIANLTETTTCVVCPPVRRVREVASVAEPVCCPHHRAPFKTDPLAPHANPAPRGGTARLNSSACATSVIQVRAKSPRGLSCAAPCSLCSGFFAPNTTTVQCSPCSAGLFAAYAGNASVPRRACARHAHACVELVRPCAV